jgi:MFS family permease
MKLLGALAFAVGAALPVGVHSDALRGMLVTLFGLLSAGLIPAMSLMVSMSYPSSYSVARIQSLDREIGLLLERMKATLALNLAGAVLALVSQAGLPKYGFELPFYGSALVAVDRIPDRLVAGSILACLVLSLDRLRLYVVAFRAVRKLRMDLALEEARDRLKSQAPDAAVVRTIFPSTAGSAPKVDAK